MSDYDPLELTAGDTGGEEPFFTGVPSYMIGADNHNLGNSQPSLLSDPGAAISNGAKFAVSATVRAAASTWNIVPTVGNWLGGDFEKADTGEILRGFDDNLGDYYDANRTSVDIVGDIAASLVPGLGGVKVLNWGQKAIALAAEGRAGLNMAVKFGTLPSKSAMYAQKAAAEMSQSTMQFSWINGNVLKSLATGYGQAALEGAAFEIAASTALNSSPLFEKHDVSDVLYNALLGGGLVGGALMGSLTAASTYGVVRKALKATDRALNPARTLTEVGAGSLASEKILAATDDLHTVLTKPEGLVDDTIWNRTLERREQQLNNDIRTNSHALAKGDEQIGNLFADGLKGLDSDTSYTNLMGLKRIGRVTADLAEALSPADVTAIKKAVAKDGFKLFTKDYGEEVSKRVAAASQEKFPVKTLRLFGEDAGKVFEEIPPAALSLADTVEAGQLDRAVKARGFSQADTSWTPAVGSVQDTEARYIWARTQTLQEGATIGVNDFPLLERAYELNIPTVNIKHLDGTVEELSTSNGRLLDLLEEQKLNVATKLLDDSAANVEGVVSTAEIAKRLNTKVSYLEGEVDQVNRGADLFAMQSAAEEYTARMIKNGQWKSDKGIIETWKQPQHVKLAYDPSLLADQNGMVLDALSYLQARKKVYELGMNNVHASYVGSYNPDRVAQFPEISGSVLLKADRRGSAPGFATTAPSEYGGLSSLVQSIGNATSGLIKDIKSVVSDTFSGHALKIAQSPQASLELATIRQQVLQTPEKYVYRNGEMVNLKQAKFEDAQAQYQQAVAAGDKKAKAPVQPTFDDVQAPVRISVSQTETQDFLESWVKHNDEKYLTPQMQLRNQQGLQVQDMRGTVYFPGVSPKDFPFHAFVTDPSVTSTGQSRMIWARSQTELEALAKKVPTELAVVYKSDVESYYRALKQYDYNLGINQNYMDAALKRSGVAAPFFPQTDGTKIVQDLVAWRGDADSWLARDMISGKYSNAFTTLERIDNQFNAAATSKAQGRIADLKDKTYSPFKSYINTALDLREGGMNPLWTGVNNMVESAFSKLHSNVEDLWKGGKSDTEIDQINAAFQKAGITTVPYDASLELLANHSAPKPVLSNFIRKANSIMSTFMLRADPLNAVNNGLGANVLLGSETASLIRAIKAGSEEGAGELARISQVGIPGIVDSAMLSPTKLVTSAYGNYFKSVIGDGNAELKKFYRDNGWLTTISDQFQSTLEQLSLKGGESAADISSRLSKASALTKQLGDLAERATGNRFAEEMNRFVAADVARQISDLGVKHGVIGKAEQLSYINTFINRTQGNFLASQRPALFQGPVGQAIGLFQTYQFNMLQQIFRHVSEGSKKDAAILLGLQGSIYGMNGLPAFNAINQYIVGGAAGNSKNRDIISTTYDVAGKEAGDWLLYGFSSNMFLHPDLKVNLYSRGDINPRNATLVPTNLADIPVVGFATKFFGAVQATAGKLGNGADVWPTIMQGIEHSGISRPLAGLAQVAEALGSPNGKSYSTTTKGDIVMQNDLFSITNLSRLVGGKPLDEAIARDAVFRVQSYQSAKTAEINELGNAVKTTIIAGGVPTPEQINGFVGKYAEAGGKQENFSKWMHRLVLNTNKSNVNAISQNVKNPYSTYMQSVMGGYQLDDPSN